MSARTTRTREQTREEYAPPSAAATADGRRASNPWHIAIPSIIVLAAVFGFFYRFRGMTRGRDAAALASDPDSQPVVSVTPPTGSGESNITPSTDSRPVAW